MGRLIEAIQEGDEAAVAQLLDSDPRAADERDENGVSALLQALYRGRTQIVSRIMESKGWMDIFEAAAMGDAGRLELTLKERPDDVKAFAGDGFTALHLAAFFGHRLAANLLLLAGADPDAEAKNAMRVRPLHSAAAGPDPMMAEALVMMGADVNAVQEVGFTALHAAAHRGNLQLTELLLGAGADPSARTDDGRSPSDLAREAGHGELANRLDRITGAG